MIKNCPHCATELPVNALLCPACHCLLYADMLKQLAGQAEQAQRQGESLAALEHWRHALDLLPPGSRQHEVIREKIDALSAQLENEQPGATSPKDQKSRIPRWVILLGPIGLLLWKFKFVLVFLFTKGKTLLFGLTKASTLFSMLLSLGVYWTQWGWMFALGLVVSIYIHEMGHVDALRRFGIKASAPMFIPMLGAVVRLKQYPASAREDARVGLAGPVWGAGAALASLAIYWGGGGDIFGAIARVGAWINLFNLLPVWQLDGGRGFRALSRQGRLMIVAVIGAMLLATSEGLLALLLLLGLFQAFSPGSPEESDPRALIEFACLVVLLSALSRLPV
ncbi:MAG: site-2 protease family protein [Acidimicrobiia bacterium]|nr:site-2 protease family protein [Acidimicrobiia bacterium]